MRLLRLCVVTSVVVLALTGCRGADVLDADQSSARNTIVAQAGQQEVPFHAVIDNTIEIVDVCPPGPGFGCFIFPGTAECEPFGPAELYAESQVNFTVSPFEQITTGMFTYRDGSELHLTAEGTGIEDPPGTAVFSGSLTFTGGTGRFTNATGSGTYAGSADLVAGTGHWTMDGVISGFGGPGTGGKRDMSD